MAATDESAGGAPAGSGPDGNGGWPGRCTLDASARLLDGGRIVIGGSPLRILRLTDRGAALLDELTSPAKPETTPAASRATSSAGTRSTTVPTSRIGRAERALLERLLDAGVIHPHPSGGLLTPGDVTVVIPAHDDPAALARTLAALAGSAPGLAEVIVVDDASGDAAAVTAAVDAIVPRPHLVRLTENQGPAGARNAGLARVRTPLVAFLDAGCEPSVGWLDALLPHFGDPALALVAPRIVAATGSGRARRTALARYEAASSALDLGPAPGPIVARTRVSYVPAAAMVGRVDALRAAGGFDTTLRVGEDVDLVWRLDRARYEPAATVGHDHPTSLRRWLRKRAGYGTSAAPLAARHPGSITPVGVSGWSAGAWALAAAGRPLAGLGVAVGTTALLPSQLQSLPHPGLEALRLGLRGHLSAGAALARACTREWWPLAAMAALGSRRARRAAVAVAAVPAVVDWWHDRPDLDPLRFTAIHLADDLAYGAGVWLGCLRERTLAPLRPDFRNWPARR